MELSGNTILITGGTSGIGLAFAERLLAAGSEVIVCGRRAERLGEITEKYPRMKTRVCDVSDPAERVALLEWAIGEFPQLNVLINNAGIQRRVDLTETEAWDAAAEEIAINFHAPVHLAMLLAPFLQNQPNPAIVNVTSGLSFAPLANVPVYCATKAALHSFTLSLRHQLAPTPVKVIEIIPPAVNTDLGGVGLHDFGVPLDEFADAVINRLQKGDLEIAYGSAERSSRASRAEADEIFKFMNQTPR